MNDRTPKRGLRAKVELDRLDPPAWIAEMRQHFAQHGTFRPKDVARMRGEKARTTGPLKQTAGSTAALLQQMARK